MINIIINFTKIIHNYLFTCDIIRFVLFIKIYGDTNGLFAKRQIIKDSVLKNW